MTLVKVSIELLKKAVPSAKLAGDFNADNVKINTVGTPKPSNWAEVNMTADSKPKNFWQPINDLLVLANEFGSGCQKAIKDNTTEVMVDFSKLPLKMRNGRFALR